MFGPPLREKPTRKKEERPPAPPPPDPKKMAEGSRPVFNATPTVPDDPQALLEILNDPKSFLQSMEAMKKLDEAYGTKLDFSMAPVEWDKFTPLVQSLVPGAKARTIQEFAFNLVPLRKMLAEQFNVDNPALTMLVDTACLAYFRVIQTEGTIICLMADVLSDIRKAKAIESLERTKEAATRELIRVLGALYAATGRQVALEPDAGVVRLLRFAERPVEKPLPERRRMARGR